MNRPAYEVAHIYGDDGKPWRIREEDPNVVRVYKRLLNAAIRGEGVRLSDREVRAVGLDDAIRTCVTTYEDERATRERNP